MKAFDKDKINIVWLKRDIRTKDQEALHAAEQSGLPYLIVYFFEPRLMAYPDTSLRHLQFTYHSILHFNEKVKAYNRRVEIFHCEAVEAFQWLQSQYNIANIFSYQESGTQITWDRDRAVAEYLNQQNIGWTQFEKDAVMRGSKNRQGWEARWMKIMTSPPTQNNFSLHPLPALDHPFTLNKHLLRAIYKYPKVFQPAGEDYAWKYLHSFVEERGKNFIQKFEVECTYETQCVNQGYESLKRVLNEQYIEKWKNGLTGFPLVDACMRCLHATGWINFRMRAMTLSLLCHHLDQDWRTGVYHFAKLFLDYEPGIHYPQFQMQAGTTGTNTVRIYNPIKNSEAHDPEGIFIKKWIPELGNVPLAFIHEPSKMTALDQSFCGVTIGKDYPLPLVNLTTTGKIARDKIWGHRKNILVQSEQQRIIKTHIKTSKKDKLK